MAKTQRGRQLKAKLFGLISLAMVSSQLLAVDCTPDSITLSSQSEVDDFQVNHGPCDTIVGVLTVSGADITDLSPLSGIISTEDSFLSKILIQDNTVLTNLDGLSGLASARHFEINNNPALSSISGLASLVSLSGPLYIQGNTSLTNVTGLGGVTELFRGALILRDNPNLNDLSGLSNLTHIPLAALVITNNGSLATLNGLSGLQSVGSNISITRNDKLESVSGLSGVTDFSAGLNIIGNLVLSSLNGLPTTTTLNSLKIQHNPALLDVDGLAGLTTIGTGGYSLQIDNNAMLENLDGLAALVSLDANLEVTRNPKLGQCSALTTLLDQVDDALPGPGPGAAGIPDVNGDVFLSGNLDGCNSVEEITGVRPAPPVELVPDFAGLGTAIGARAIVNPDNTCDWSPGETVTLSWDDPNVLLGQFVARDLSGDSYQVNPWLLPGGTGGRIRIIATDGFHTAVAESAGAFTVPEPSPAVSIASPHNGQTFSPSEWIEMRGSAHQPDGSQDGLSFLWLLDGEVIVTGKTSRIALEEGDYVLTLTAFGGAGNVGEASVNISVRDNDPPEPPASPIPADGSVDNELELVLDWIGADSNGDTLSYDVYMEAGNPAPSTLVCAGTNLSACPLPVLLAPSTTYYWRVVASDDKGGSTSGAVWEFTTRSGAPADLIFKDRFE